MILTIASYVALYVIQLIYAVKRWVDETKRMIDGAKHERMRQAIDWNAPSRRRA